MGYNESMRTMRRKGRPAKLTEDDKAQIAARYDAGETLEQLGAAFGVTATTVSRALQSLGYVSSDAEGRGNKEVA